MLPEPRFVLSFVFIYICISHIDSFRIPGEDKSPIACWRLKGTRLNLCVEEPNDDFPFYRYMSVRKRPLQQQSTINTQFSSLIDRVPFFGRDFLKPGLFKRNIDPDEDSFDVKDGSDETAVEKRPFDSISYTAGLGGFKR